MVKTSKAWLYNNTHLALTLMFDIFRVTEVTDNNLVQLETLDGKPVKTRTPMLQ